jgi:transposase
MGWTAPAPGIEVQALPPCLIGMEACASAHYWARELRKLGHEVRPRSPASIPALIPRLVT